jgi:hypothetical protein
MIEVIEFHSVKKASLETTKRASIGASVFLIGECKSMPNGCYEHLNTQNKVLEISSFLSISYESRFCSKENQHTLRKFSKLIQKYI